MAPERKTLKSYNPRTMDVIGEVELASTEEIQAAVNRADAAFPAWSAMPLSERLERMMGIRDYMQAHAEEIADLIAQEQGKPAAEALSSDILPAMEILNYFVPRMEKLLAPESIPGHILQGMKTSKVVRVPLGVVSVISPWNFPFSIPMSGILFALLTGNTVVFKPASEVPFIGRMIERVVVEGGRLPDGVFNLVLASGRDVGETLFKPPVRKVVFTGSTETGRWIQEVCARNLIPTVLELGGKDPMLVLEDADVELAARGATWAAFSNCGQVCASVERIYVVRSKYEPFVQALKEEVARLRLGTPPNTEFDVGPLANESQRETVEKQVADAVERGARVELGGKRPEGAKGLFYEPTVLTNVNHDMQVMREETFGPLLPVMVVEDAEEALRLANDSNYGLTASVWTRDRKRAAELARRLQVGTVTINDHGFTYGMVETPWHGAKESGLGKSHAMSGLLEMLFERTVCEDTVPLGKRRMWWFPYNGETWGMFREYGKALSRRGGIVGFAGKLITHKSWREAIFG